MKQEHRQKYDALIRRCGGLELLKPLMPVSIDCLRTKIAEDEHLNNIPLPAWDKAAGYIKIIPGYKCSCCGQTKPPRRNGLTGPLELSFEGYWKQVSGLHLSLAERVCMLKEAARQIAEQKEVIGG